ncbi:hypothetical protein BOX15_Mlig032132g1 [Macrostomum lignano]|uniref:Uncharacterized protein n=1 Tax=Macrostomum lignano TaxID=282301 RepID=A0A267EFP4_9PLAT|nr:hypothetical protein BOX15_Mlig032132g1 [Macrostomum lignano]
MLQESLSKRKSRLSQASNEDQPRSGAEHGSHEHHRGVQHHRGARGGFLESGEPTVSVRETRTESEEIGEPEEEVMTFTDEHGSRITKKVVRRRQVRKVITNKVVESHATHGPPCFDTHSGGGGEGAGDGGGPLLERTINGVPEVRRETRITRRNLVISGEGEDESFLNDAIYQQTGFDKGDATIDEENLNAVCMANSAAELETKESDV